MKRIIFLDIDGVLVNRKSLKERSGLRAVADEQCVAALNWLTTYTDSEIVLSSSWRFCGLEEMRIIFKHWGVTGHLLDITPDYTREPIEPGGLYVAMPRANEIQGWLDGQSERPEFVIIDDMSNMEHLQYRLIKTEFEIGLTMTNASKALPFFNMRIPQ